MRVCFLFYGQAFDEIAKVMIRSVREHMPNAIVTQLTDQRTKKVQGVDELRRVEGRLHGYLSTMHMMTCPLPFIRLDYDMILQGDLSHILEGDHDLAFNTHGDDFVLGTEYGKKYPIAGSVAGYKTHEFAKDLRREAINSHLDDWLGGAHLHNEVAKKYKVKLLEGQVYNYTPKDREDRPKHALVLHYKGMRKHWMLPPELKARAEVDEKNVAAKVMEYKHPETLHGTKTQ